MKSSELRQMISKIVAEELKVQLPKVISEIYLRNLVNEAAPVREQPKRQQKQSQPADSSKFRETLREQMLADDEPQQQQRVASPLLNKQTNPMAFLYEDVEPIPDEGEEPSEYDAVDESIVEGLDFSKFSEMFDGNRKAENSAMPETPEMKMRRIEENRRRLEVKV